ncbi:MAG: VOC family protein [Rhizobiaceae bacterium]
MQIGKLDHVNVRTNQLESMIDWYTRILGLKKGPRPNFGFHGAWMYSGDDAVVHLVEVDEDPGAGSETNLKVEHFALSASGKKSFEARLVEAGEDFKVIDLDDVGITQYNIWDPDKNHIHIDFQFEDQG